MNPQRDDQSQRDLLPVRVVVDSCIFPQTRKWLIPLVQAAETGYLDLIWSPLTIAEANRVLTWLWVKRHGGDLSEKSWLSCSESAKKMFLHLTRVFRVVDDRPPLEDTWTEHPSDEWDVPIWTAAVRAESHFIITENLSDGPPEDVNGCREYAGIIFVHPATFLEFLNYLTDLIESEGLARIPDEFSLTDEGQHKLNRSDEVASTSISSIYHIYLSEHERKSR